MNIAIFQLVNGQWVIGKPEHVEAGKDLVVESPLALDFHPGQRPGELQVMLHPYGFPVLQNNPKSSFSHTFLWHSLMSPPVPAPQNLAALYTQETSSIQIAPAGSVPQRPVR